MKDKQLNMDQENLPNIDIKTLLAPKKGKSATKGQKQIYEENRETLKWYTIMAGITLLLKLLLTSSFTTTTSTMLTIFAALVQGVALAGMYFMAKPVLSGASKNVVDGGVDLNLSGGFADKLKDLVTTTSFCTVTSMYSNGFWCVWLWLPAYYVYKFWVGVVAPWIFQPAPEGPPPEVAEKKRRKMERKMARAGYGR